MKPEMMATIRDYDPSNTSDPITKAWDSTQNKVCFRDIHIECSKQFKRNLYFYVSGQSGSFGQC